MEYLVAGPYVRADWCRAREAEGWDLVGVPDHLTGRGLSWTHLFVTAAEVEAGLGAGWRRDELGQMGVDLPPPPVRARRFRDAVRIVRDLVHTGSCHFESEHYRVVSTGSARRWTFLLR